MLLISSVLVMSLYGFLNKTRRAASTQRLRANIESLTQISFFMMGRDIRRAGSNPKGILGVSQGTAIPLGTATATTIRIYADLDGNGAIAPNSEEDITYEFIDDPLNPDGVPDQIRRQSGNELVIENVQAFDLCYQLASGTGPYDPSDPSWDCNPADPALIRKVHMRLEAGTGRINQDTGTEDTKEIQMDILLRNFR